MSTTETLLVELVCEELPPKALKRLSEAFAGTIETALRADAFASTDSVVNVFATPRRLALTISQVLPTAPDKAFKEKLLPVSVAYDAQGKPTAALLGKLKAKQLAHLDPATLPREHDGKTDVLYYAAVAKGGPLVNALQTALDQAIEKLPIPKVMSYASPGSYYNDQKFVRPARALVTLHGSDIVPVTALGLQAGRSSAGHRFMSRGAIDIASAEGYESTLEAEGKVTPRFAKRRAQIAAAVEHASEHAQVIMPDALLDEVTALVELPTVYAGTFDRAFLDVPQECLILTMQQNQKYFPLADASGKLRHRFLLVSNLRIDDPVEIVHGNERVLRARLADAKFFYDQDRARPLETRLPRLSSVVYHNKLGSQLERIGRVRTIAAEIAATTGADKAQVDRAAMLAKADLVTDMVGEFPELQGTMGRYYALHDGEADAVADAIAQHYWPRFAGDTLPQGPVATTVALADKIEALVGMFGIGNAPTGDKDPFGLRRAALGVLRILLDGGTGLRLDELIAVGFSVFPPSLGLQDTRIDLLTFLLERLRGTLRDQGYTANQVDAVVSMRPVRIDQVPGQMHAVKAFATLPEAEALAAANKRIINILKKSANEAATAVNRSLLGSGAEEDLYGAVEALLPVVRGHVERGDHTEALRVLATVRGPVDRFFDDVMVMVDDRVLRSNRLALLRRLAEAMNQVADISKLAG